MKSDKDDQLTRVKTFDQGRQKQFLRRLHTPLSRHFKLNVRED